MTLVYLDTETTGLDAIKHQVWEIAWAVEDEEIRSSLVSHSLLHADPKALEMNGYSDRADGKDVPSSNPEWALRYAITGATIVGANPAFDAAMLRARWREAPWHYRMLDIETYAMPALGLDIPKGLHYIAQRLNIQAPDHSAAGDVYTLRECHRALRAIYLEWKP